MRQDSTVRLLYEEEENESMAERREGQSASRNPYLADYARQRGGQAVYGQRGEDGDIRRQERTKRQKGLSLDWYQTNREPVRQARRQESAATYPARAGRAGSGAGRKIRQQTAQAGAACAAGRQSREMQPPVGRTRPIRSAGEPGSSVQPQAVLARPIRSGKESGYGRGQSVGLTRPVRSAGETARIHIQRPAGAPGRRPAASAGQAPARRRSAAAGGALSRRRQRVLMQRVAVGLWALCIVVLAVIFVVRNDQASAAGSPKEDVLPGMGRQEEQAPGKSLVQGLPADVYAKHPDWTESFLTPNEYSRPGDALESVTNIFVHYTANPGTSAAQNRSYFEQQKDTHEASVSAHFIIGYEGEIIQCVPLDEIAYAVMTRNYDSISIECCYLAKDGSFTQETYDSLVSLLAWLTDAYDLEADDILRHYDCGGKKCPLYYTDHPGEWEQLKKDVKEKKEA